MYRFIEILIVILVEYQPFIVEGAQISNPKRFLKHLFCATVSADNLHPRASARKVSKIFRFSLFHSIYMQHLFYTFL